MPTLKALHVMPLIPGREPELAADARQLLASGVCTEIAAIMTLVPEGDPPEDKARILGDRFRAFREVFAGDPSRLGILAQATIGHGWPPNEPATFQKIVRPGGDAAYQMCPLDADFQAYIRDTFTQLAALAPAFIMVDDDFRLLSGRDGCYCPLHLAAIGQRLGRTFSRESLLATLREDPAASRAYDDVLRDSLLELAGVIRDAIDAVDPGIIGSFCICDGGVRYADPLVRRLAGAGHAPLVRINNSRYLTAEMRSFPRRMYQGAAQVAGLAPDVTILAETDTCRHNRYSTAAQLLHAHYTGSILEGCHGAKHWITRSGAWQPASGRAYRAVLAAHRGFYETLYQAVQASSPAGYTAAALPTTAPFNPAPDHVYDCAAAKTWAALLGSFGLPCNFVRMPTGPTLLTGADVGLFPDDDLRRLLANNLLLEGAAAEKLCARGFGAALGVTAEPWTGPRVSGERWGDVELLPCRDYSRLTPTSPRTSIHSQLLHRRSGVSQTATEIGPAVTLYDAPDGARVAVCAGSFAPYNRLPDAGFYDEDRKRELVELLGWVGAEPVLCYYPGDAEVYLKLRRFPDGRLLLALFNLGHDPLDRIPLVCARPIVTAEQLSPAGAWEPVTWRDGELHSPLPPATPRVFRLTPTP